MICSRPYHALFMHIMLIRPTRDELAASRHTGFCHLQCRAAVSSNRLTAGMCRPKTKSIDLSLEDRELVILGTEYAGEMKKGVFTVANYFAPLAAAFSPCTVVRPPPTKTVANRRCFLPLSGTGKTTLSADPKRHLIGDDEHCWSDEGIFNPEGGCYAKAVNLTPENEPDIFNAGRFKPRCSKMSCSMRTAAWISPIRASRKTRRARVPHRSSYAMHGFPAWPVIQRTSFSSPATRLVSCRR